VDVVLAAYHRELADFRRGRDKIVNYLMGQVMRAEPRLNPQAIRKAISGSHNPIAAAGCARWNR
jgi:Asp-tRNA(Asn)/Glu-tRNA(Gln) amidotransferase B subunit